MKISILVNETSPASVISGAVDLFSNANEMWNEVNPDSNVKTFFETELITTGTDPVNCMNDFPVHCGKKLEEVQGTELIIITPITHDIVNRVAQKRNVIDWLTNMHNNGVQLASLCTGAFLLGATGLVDNKTISTHWAYANLFRKLYPQVNISSHKIIIDENGIYSSGGAFTFTNLILYLIDKFCGHEVGVMVSKSMLVDMHQMPQSVFSIFQPQRDHDDERIKEAQDHIERNYHRRMTINEIAEKVYLARGSFIRRFKKATHNTPIEYLQRVRVEAVKKALEANHESIQNIVIGSGYSDQSSFRRIFKRYTGLNPQAYRNKFRRM